MTAPADRKAPWPKLHGGGEIADNAADLAEPDKKAERAVEKADPSPAEHTQRRGGRQASKR